MPSTAPYFLAVRTIDVAPTPHLDRAAIIEAIARQTWQHLRLRRRRCPRRALAHPGSPPPVEKVLPETIIVRLEERRPSGAVILDAPYLVDATGRPFAAVEAHAIAGLPIVTARPASLRHRP
ncbi:MAG: hypothetical protein R3F65_03480 [bacterium]